MRKAYTARSAQWRTPDGIPFTAVAACMGGQYERHGRLDGGGAGLGFAHVMEARSKSSTASTAVWSRSTLAAVHALYTSGNIRNALACARGKRQALSAPLLEMDVPGSFAVSKA